MSRAQIVPFSLAALAGFVAADALTQDWRPALAAALLQLILLRIGAALLARIPAARRALVHGNHSTHGGFGGVAGHA
jgi:hypothetical protein